MFDFVGNTLEFERRTVAITVAGNGTLDERMRETLHETQDGYIKFTHLANDEPCKEAWKDLVIDDLIKLKGIVQTIRNAVEAGDISDILTQLAEIVEVEMEPLAVAVTKAILISQQIDKAGIFDE